MKKIITIICISLLINISLLAQEKDSSEFEKHYSFEFTTGVNNLLYFSYFNNDNLPLSARNYLTRSNELNFNYIKARLLYNFDEKWNLALGLSLQQLRSDDASVGKYGQFTIGLDYNLYNNNKNLIGISFDAGIHTSELGPSFGFGAFWIHKLSPRFDLVINPVFDLNYYEKTSYNANSNHYYYDKGIRSELFSLNFGIRINTLKKTDEYESLDDDEKPASVYVAKDKSFGFSFGINLLTLNKEKYYNDLTVPVYKNDFYYRNPLYPTFDLVYKSKENFIHSLEVAYRNYDDSEPGIYGKYDMTISVNDFMLAYKCEMPISQKGFKDKQSNPTIPYIGLQLLYDKKAFTIKDYEWDPFTTKSYYVDINSKSNLFLLQLSPSIKKLFNHFYLDFGLNINLAGIASGDYTYYNVIKDSGGHIIQIKDNVTTNYTSFISPDKFFSNWYFVHNISFKLGYMF